MRMCVMAATVAIGILTSASPATVIRLQASKDNTLFEENAAYSNGRGTGLFAGETSVGQKRRGLIGFDLSSIPAGSVITSATLTMRMSRTTSGSEPVQLHFSLASWGEGTSNADIMGGGGGDEASPEDATWSHRFFGGESWTTPGGDFRPEASSLSAVAGVGFYSWTGPGLLADTQTWLNNPASNNGWFVLGNESINQTAKRFDTREAASLPNRPVLTIDYTVPTPGSMGLISSALALTTLRRRR